MLLSNRSVKSLEKLPTVSLSNFDIKSPHNHDQAAGYYENQPINANSFNTKSNQAIDQAVEQFQQILARCATSSHTITDQSERKNDLQKKLEAKKRDCEEFLRSLNMKAKSKIKQRDPNIDCRKLSEERNYRIKTKRENRYGSVFYCRKALVQKPNGITYICIRKRFN